MLNEDEFIKRSPPLRKSGTIILPKVGTDTLKLLNPNADALIMGSATEEGGNLKIYRDGSGNLQLSVDADAASNGEALKVYGGAVCQNYLTVGQNTLSSAYPFYVNGHTFCNGNILNIGYMKTTNGIRTYNDNAASLYMDIVVTGTDATSHEICLAIDTNHLICAKATGDGAGGIVDKAIGLYGVTPAVQAAHIADPAESTAGNNAAIDAILVALENIGILASS